MANYECSTCDYCDKNRKQGNKLRCIRFSKFVEGLSICEEFTNKEWFKLWNRSINAFY